MLGSDNSIGTAVPHISKYCPRRIWLLDHGY